MAEAFNPYTPPAAELDVRRQVGSVVRDGRLVRMEREGQLPARCVGCNAPAGALRVERTLYWMPWQWRLPVVGVPAGLFVLMALGVEFAAILFIPALLIAILAGLVLRTRARIELGICEKHRRWRALVQAGGIALVLVVLALTVAAFTLRSHAFGPWLLVFIPLMLVVGTINGFSTTSRVTLARVTGRHLWLKHTGKAFHDSLPEAASDQAATV